MVPKSQPQPSGTTLLSATDDDLTQRPNVYVQHKMFNSPGLRDPFLLNKVTIYWLYSHTAFKKTSKLTFLIKRCPAISSAELAQPFKDGSEDSSYYLILRHGCYSHRHKMAPSAPGMEKPQGEWGRKKGKEKIPGLSLVTLVPIAQEWGRWRHLAEKLCN